MSEEKKEENKKENEEREQREKEESAEEVRDRLLRLAAEFDNYKKRSVKDLDNAKGMGKAELTSKLLPILDEFELAIKNLDMKNERDKGLALVYSNMRDALKKEGLEELNPSGKVDPYMHEVIMVKESDEKEGTVLDVIRKGYAWKGMMLRPAAVIVSNGMVDDKKENKNEK